MRHSSHWPLAALDLSVWTCMVAPSSLMQLSSRWPITALDLSVWTCMVAPNSLMQLSSHWPMAALAKAMCGEVTMHCWNDAESVSQWGSIRLTPDKSNDGIQIMAYKIMSSIWKYISTNWIGSFLHNCDTSISTCIKHGSIKHLWFCWSAFMLRIRCSLFHVARWDDGGMLSYLKDVHPPYIDINLFIKSCRTETSAVRV